MKVKIRDTIYDSEIEPIAIGFENDKERISVGNQIINQFENKPGKRVYVQYPGDGSGKKAESHLPLIEEFVKDLL